MKNADGIKEKIIGPNCFSYGNPTYSPPGYGRLLTSSFENLNHRGKVCVCVCLKTSYDCMTLSIWQQQQNKFLPSSSFGKVCLNSVCVGGGGVGVGGGCSLDLIPSKNK